MEKLLIKANGQWELVKWDAKRQQKARDWIVSGDRRNLTNLPPLEGGKRRKMMASLKSETEHRVNPDTGKLEFLLHRAHIGKDPFSTPKSYLGMEDDAETHLPEHQRSPLTSWTVDKDHASYWKEISSGTADQNADNTLNITSKWIPHDQLHSSLIDEAGSHEGEVLVHPQPIYNKHGFKG